jgi:hypothetical protein
MNIEFKIIHINDWKNLAIGVELLYSYDHHPFWRFL